MIKSIPYCLLLILFSCDQSILSYKDRLCLDDAINPVITITKPKDGGYYAASVIVDGTATDLANTTGDNGEIASIGYEVIGTNVQGNITLTGDNFTFTFSTKDFTGAKTLKITAHDWNANKGICEITLNEGAFPTFQALPGNQRIDLTWEPVDFATSYTLFYAEGSSLPLETNTTPMIELESTVYALENLTNGQLYSFQLRANTDNAGTSWSNIIHAIPLSPFTLAPVITGGYKKITLDWNPIKGIDSFIVSRSTTRQGAFVDFPIYINGCSFTDTQVEDAVRYYYNIRPAIAGSLTSAINSGETIPIPPFGMLVGACNTPHYAYQVKVRDTLAFIANKDSGITNAGISGLQIVDIADPANPRIIGACNTPNNAYALALDGDYVYIADDASGLQVIDISKPAEPVLIGSCNTPGYAYDVAIKEGYAFIADGAAGLQIIDIASDRTNPVLIGSYDTTGQALGVAIHPTLPYVYIADGYAGLVVIDISDPENMVSSTWDTTGSAQDVELAGNYAYVADGIGGLVVIDITGAPAGVGICDTPGQALSVTLDANYAYVADDTGGLVLINISNPAAPFMASTCESAYAVKGVAVQGTYGYLAAQDGGLQIVNTGGPHRMETLTTYSSGSNINRVALNGRYAYITSANSCLQVLDLINPASPAVLPPLLFPGSINPDGVLVCGDYAFVTGIHTGLQIVSVVDPAAPVISANVENDKTTTGAALMGDYICIAYRESSGESGVKIYDVAIPDSPVFINDYQVNDYARGIAVKKNRVYTADSVNGLHITDLSDILNPQILSAVETPGTACDVQLFGAYALIADGASGIQLINTSLPVPDIATCATQGIANAVALCSSYALIANITKGIQVIDLAKPAMLQLMGALTVPGNAQYITVQGKYAFLSVESIGLQVIDLCPDY